MRANAGSKVSWRLAAVGAFLVPGLALAQEPPPPQTPAPQAPAPAPTSPSASAIIDACMAAYEASNAAPKSGKLLEARSQLVKCAESACPEDIRALCTKRLPELTSRIPTILFDVKDPDGHDLTPVRLTVDGVLYAEHLNGASLTLDPVDHEFTFEVPGQAPVTRHFVLHDREARRELITIGTAAPKPPPVPPPPPPDVPQPTSSHWSTQKLVGYSLIGVGVVAAGIGSGFGLDAMSKQSDAKPKCPQTNLCYPEGKKLIDDAKTDATVSTVMFVISGVAAAGGITMVLIAPSTPTTPPTARATTEPTPARLQVLLGAPRSLAGLSLGGAW